MVRTYLIIVTQELSKPLYRSVRHSVHSWLFGVCTALFLFGFPYFVEPRVIKKTCQIYQMIAPNGLEREAKKVVFLALL